MRFHDRTAAGRQLGTAVADLDVSAPVVLALPRGVFRLPSRSPRSSVRRWRCSSPGRSVPLGIRSSASVRSPKAKTQAAWWSIRRRCVCWA